MKIIPFIHMTTAIENALNSAHPTNKIGATLFGTDTAGDRFFVSKTNNWPNAIDKKIGRDEKIGNSSGTIHAETACILNSPFGTENSAVCITDPFCPNCAKNIAESGIKTIYIDSKGFEKDFFKRRSGHFDTMSMQICERAGINVFAIDIEKKEITSILEIPDDYLPVEDSPIHYQEIKDANEETFKKVIQENFDLHKKRKFSTALVKDIDDNIYALTARAHAVTGYTMKDPEEAIDLLVPVGKYSFIQEPVNRLMMHMARKNLFLIYDYLFCSQVPTSREQVNLVGADVKRITIGDLQKCRDVSGLKAMKQLSNAKIIDYS